MNSELTPTQLCEIMNKVYDMLKTMTIEQIEDARRLADMKMSTGEAELFRHQCNYALLKKQSGAWPK